MDIRQVPSTPPTPAASKLTPAPTNEKDRLYFFIGIQAVFLAISLFTGGFNFTVWSMMDSALLIVAIGVTGLTFVIDDQALQKFFFYMGLFLYLCGVIDMGLNVLLTGLFGWGKF